jgi:hypothetical protein
MTKPISEELKAEMVKAEHMGRVTVAKLRELADHLEKTPGDLESTQYGVDPFSDEPRFQTLTVRWRLDEKTKG